MTLDKAIKLLLVKEPFYGLFIMSLNRRYDDSIPTACVERNGINIDLLVNEKFWNTLTDDEQLGVIKHEVKASLLH